MADEFECPLCGGPVVPAPVGRRMACSPCSRTFSRHECKTKVPGTRKKSQTTRGRQEKRTAKTYGGRQTLNSGAMSDKGDVKVEGVLRIEDKTTRARSYVLKLEDLQKVARAANGDEMPVMKVSFEDDLRKQYVIIPEAWFAYLIKASGILDE